MSYILLSLLGEQYPKEEMGVKNIDRARRNDTDRRFVSTYVSLPTHARGPSHPSSNSLSFLVGGSGVHANG
jgi:hypothetical protein